jgi:hypothetical protein
MFKNFLTGIQILWGNIKPAILAFVIPSLNSQRATLADYLRKREGTPEEQADWVIKQITEYLTRQL